MSWKDPFNWLYGYIVEANEMARLKELYSQFVDKGDLAFDLGANTGSHSEVLQELGCKVVAIEPNQEHIDTLHSKLYNHKPRGAVIWAGVGSQEGYQHLHCFNHHSHNTFIKNSPKCVAFNHLRSEKVWMTTLPFLVEKYGVPKFMKIDVEGYEWEVLQRLLAPVKYIAFEYSPSMLNVAGKCIDFLAKKGYTFNYSLSIFHKLKSEEWLDAYFIKQHLMEQQKVNFGMIYARLKE